MLSFLTKCLLLLQEVVILILAIVRNGNEVSVINGIGMVVCLTGITAHVIRKATRRDFDSSSTLSDGRRSAYEKVSLHCSDDEAANNLTSDSEDSNFRPTSRRPRSFVDASSVINVKESVPLLSDDSDSAEEVSRAEAAALANRGGRQKSRSVSSDDFIFREKRAWTSVRDRHLEMPGLATDDEDILAEAAEIVSQHERKERFQKDNAEKTANLLSD